MTNVREILEKARAVGARLSPSEASVLFASAIRHAAAQGTTLRPHLVQIDDTGAVHVAPFDERAPETDPGYLAPELQGADAPKRTEDRVQVFAAGALGYELFTGRRPAGRPPGAELTGPLTDVIRVAMAADRNERFPDLRRLQDAIEVLQPRPPAEGERSILAALRMRAARVAPEKEALAKLIEKVHHLEEQVQLLGKAQTRLEAAQRETSEHLERFTEGQARLGKTKQGPSILGPVVVAALVAVVGTIGVVWAMGNLGAKPGPPTAPHADVDSTPDAAVAEPAKPEPVPAPVKPEPVRTPPPPKEATPPPPIDAGAAAAAPDAGTASEATAATSESDAGAPDAAIAASEPATPAPPAKTEAPPKTEPPPPPKKRASPQAAMQHALATTAVRRGEAALEQNRPGDALESFRAALESEPNNAEAFRGMGMAYAMQGHDQQALQAYAKYLRFAPSAADARDIRRSIAELKARSKVGGGEK